MFKIRKEQSLIGKFHSILPSVFNYDTQSQIKMKNKKYKVKMEKVKMENGKAYESLQTVKRTRKNIQGKFVFFLLTMFTISH